MLKNYLKIKIYNVTSTKAVIIDYIALKYLLIFIIYLFYYFLD